MKHLKIVPFMLAILVSGGYLLTVPDLPFGPFYDRLMNLRGVIEAPRDLVVIDTKAQDAITAEDASRILLVLSALESRLVLFQTNVVLPDERQSFSSQDRQRLVQKEFSRIQKNISSLFDGIRLGSIRPQDAERYVKDVNGLVEESKNRLLLTLAESSNMRELELEKYRALFNRVIHCDDLQWGAGKTGALEIWGGKAVYSKAEKDADGVLRYLYPIKELPNKELVHAGFALLMDIMGDPQIEKNGTWLNIKTEKELYELPLDSKGRFYVQKPEHYQVLSIEEFTAYLEQERKLYEALKEMERSGYFINLDALKYPTTLYEYAQSLEKEVLENPLPDTIRQWREARNDYYAAAGDFLTGSAEKTILQGYDTLLTTETLQEGGKERITSLKELASQAFSWSRNAYHDLFALHTRLESSLRDAYCIVGSVSGDANATVALLSTLLSRNYIYPGKPLYLYIATIIGLLLLLGATFIFSPLYFVVFTIVIAGTALLVGGMLLIIGGYWYAPLIPAIVFLGTGALYGIIQAAYVMYVRRHQELALKHRMSPGAFKALLRSIPLKQVSSVPTPDVIQEVEALILCVRHASFIGEEQPAAMLEYAEALKQFRARTSELVKQKGGTMLWADGEVVFTAFGFPSLYYDKQTGIAEKALGAVQSLLDAFLHEPVTLGMDFGKAAYYFDAIAGYSALGRVPVRARVLSGLAARYQRRMLVTDAALSFLRTGTRGELRADKLDVLVDKQEGREIAFFSFNYNGHSGS
ncbi:MAG: hypothetical protein LDL24_02060 [Treponema sp.]|nr:hypothetical protein [Treponema sp.]